MEEVLSWSLEVRAAFFLFLSYWRPYWRSVCWPKRRLAPAGRAPVGSLHVNSPSQNRANLGVQGLPTGPNQLPYPMRSTPANDAAVRNNAWAAYNANLHQIPTAPNPNRLAAPQKLVDQDRFIQQPNSSRRYNFQFSDNEVRSVQRALRRTGNYSGQVDGILGPDTKRAIQEYQLRNKLPVTGQPDQWLKRLAWDILD